jgi:aminopeptidase N
VSDGAFVKREETDAGAIETWEVTSPIKRSFAAGPYEVVRQRCGGREVGVYLLSAKPSGAAEQAKALADSIAAMEARFGPFPYPGYAIVEVPDDLFTWYAASQQSFILAQSSAFQFDRGNLPLFAHEAAHAWWGNLIATGGPGAILCSESLAQYSAVIAIEAVEGPKAATEFLRFSRAGYNLQQCAKGYFEMSGRGEDMPLSKLGSGGWQHNLSDAKGHWVFHMLRRQVGDDVFFATMRSLIRKFAHRTMTLDDVRGAFIEAAPPEAGLKQFFRQWLDRKGAPILEVEWSDASADDRHRARLIIRQIQKEKPYHLKLDVAVDAESGTTMHCIDLTKRKASITLDAKGPPTGVRLDPDYRLLIWTPEYGTPPAKLLPGREEEHGDAVQVP